MFSKWNPPFCYSFSVFPLWYGHVFLLPRSAVVSHSLCHLFLQLNFMILFPFFFWKLYSFILNSLVKYFGDVLSQLLKILNLQQHLRKNSFWGRILIFKLVIIWFLFCYLFFKFSCICYFIILICLSDETRPVSIYILMGWKICVEKSV